MTAFYIKGRVFSALDTNYPPNHNGLPGFRAHHRAPKKREQTQAQEEDHHQRGFRCSSCMRGWCRHLRGCSENRFLHKKRNPDTRCLREATRGPKHEAGRNDLRLRGVQREMQENPR
ncbi:hypothetical protein V8G54_007372 [Vigna mungo]|uniref:Uncharacterized protein n=1 Tax=Vigna mungo TaxID=3915 RepID=A0AAQ3P360_VIGMU